MYILNKIYKYFFFIPKKRMKYVVGLFSVIIQEKVTPVFWQKITNHCLYGINTKLHLICRN